MKSPVPPSVAEQTSNPLDCKTEGVSGLNQPFLSIQWWTKVQYSVEKWQRSRRQSVSIMRAGESQRGGFITIWYSGLALLCLAPTTKSTSQQVELADGDHKHDSEIFAKT